MMIVNGVFPKILESVLAKAMSTGADYAEVFLENTDGKTISLMDGKVYTISDQVISGASVRIYKGLRSVFASTTDMTEKGLLACAEKVAAVLGEGSAPMHIHLRERIFGDIHPVKIVPSSVANQDKIGVLKEACAAAKAYHESISQVSGSILDVDHKITIANSEGLRASDRQIRSRIRVGAVASRGGENQTGSCAPGKRRGFELYEIIDPKAVGVEAAEQAVTMLNAGYCPAGKMPVAIGNGFGGVIFHEACGHSLEASSVAKGQSVFAGKLGQQIAGTKVSAVDDGTITNAWGSANIDDEGNFTKRNLLIENGILKGYMVDTLNGRRMNMPSTSSSRRQSYKHVTTSRMTNTFILNGEDSLEDMIASMEYGLYCKSMSGGSVNPSTGDFNFAVQEGYLVENGKIVKPVKGASLIGNGGDTLLKIDMVGTNLKRAQGMCGASSGSVPTDVGQPAIRVSSMIVGGRN